MSNSNSELYSDHRPASRLLNRLWRNYLDLNQQIRHISDALRARGDHFRNDHIALRAYDRAGIDLEAIEAHWLGHGYVVRGEYRFEQKKLRARHYEHPDADLPLVFVSELCCRELSPQAQTLIDDLVAQLPADFAEDEGFLCGGRPWQLDLATYERLAQESEYAGWVAAFGFRANHFTVDVDTLVTFEGIGALNDWLEASGFTLNDSGGKIKGSAEVFLKQSATLAEPVEVDFNDGGRTMPGCYVEFAQRYPMPDGRVFSGFVADNANSIFDSTNRQMLG